MASLYKQLKKILEQEGCHFLREGKGSHEIWFSPISNKPFPVPANIDNRHTANGILKQAGIKRKI